MGYITDSNLYEASRTGQAWAVSLVLGDEYPPLKWGNHCTSCQTKTDGRVKISGSVSERVDSRTTRVRTFETLAPVCPPCEKRHTSALLAVAGGVLGVGVLAAFVGLVTGGRPAAITYGAGGVIAAIVVAVLLAKLPGIMPTLGGVVVRPSFSARVDFLFKNRDAARELVVVNAASPNEASKVLIELE